MERANLDRLLEAGRIGEISAAIRGFRLGSDFKAAVRWTMKTLDRFPGNSQILYELGMTYFNQGQHDAAIRAFSMALNTAVPFSEVKEWKFVAESDQLRLQHRFDEAERVMRTALRESPNSVHVINQMGLVHYDLGRYREAVEDFDRALAIEPGGAFAREWRLVAKGALDRSDGWRLEDEGERKRKFESARRNYAEAIRLRDMFPEAHLGLGATLADLKLTDEAEWEYRRATTLNPRFAEAFFNLGLLLREMPSPRPADAETAFRRALEHRPDFPKAHLGLIQSMADRRAHREAVAHFPTAFELGREDPMFLVNLGLAMSNIRQHEEAVSAFRRAIEIQPDSDAAYAALGLSLSNLNRGQEAEAALRKALNLGDASGHTANNLARQLIQMGRAEEAERFVRLSLKAGRTWQALATQATIHLEFARRYLDDDEYGYAVDTVTEALGLVSRNAPGDEPDGGIALLHLQHGIALANLRQFGEARDAFRTCREKGPPDSPVRLAAERNLRRVNRRFRRGGEVPAWFPYFLVAVAVLALGYSVSLIQTRQITGAAFVPVVLGALFVLLVSFFLPAMTRLKLGGAELEKQPEVVGAPPLETISPTLEPSIRSSKSFLDYLDAPRPAQQALPLGGPGEAGGTSPASPAPRIAPD